MIEKSVSNVPLMEADLYYKLIDNTKLYCYTPLRRSPTVSLDLPLLNNRSLSGDEP